MKRFESELLLKLRLPRIALFCAIPALRPHMSAVVAQEPLLLAAWIVGRQGLDALAGA